MVHQFYSNFQTFPVRKLYPRCPFRISGLQLQFVGIVKENAGDIHINRFIHSNEQNSVSNTADNLQIDIQRCELDSDGRFDNKAGSSQSSFQTQIETQCLKYCR